MFLTLSVLLCSIASIGRAQAVGDLLVTPTRLVFNKNAKNAELTLLNIGKAKATYRMSFIHMRMREDGGLELAEETKDGEQFADNMIIFTPRVVTLEPRISQTIRLIFRRPGSLAAGEYRSHLLFRAVPTQPAPGTADAGEPGGISIALTAIYGVSIPIIVREGDTTAKITMIDPKFTPAVKHTDAVPPAADEPACVSFRCIRSGNQSSYGDFKVTFKPKTGKEQIVGILNGVAVYTPNATRSIKILLNPPKDVELTSGRLTITYQKKADDGGDIWAETSIDIP